MLNNPDKKIALFPCGTELGCELMIMVKSLFTSKKFIFVDNDLYNINENIISLDEAVAIPNTLYITTGFTRSYTMTKLEDSFYCILKKKGITDDSIVHIYDNSERREDSFVCQLFDCFHAKNIYDSDGYFQVKGLISKQIFNPIKEKYYELYDCNFYTDVELEYPVYRNIYSGSKDSTNYDLFFSSLKKDSSYVVRIIEANKSIKHFLFLNWEDANMPCIDGYSSSVKKYMDKSALIIDQNRWQTDECKRRKM